MATWYIFHLVLLAAAIVVTSQDIKQCEQDVDIVFIMDSSGSIGAADYLKQKDFVKQLASSFVVYPQRTQAGLMIYSDNANIEAFLGQYPTIKQFKDAVDRLPYLQKRTRIDRALKRASEEVFRKEAGHRLDKPRIVVILTDGKQTPDPDAVPLQDAVRPLHDAGVQVFAIGVGPYYKRSELQLLVQRDRDIYEASNFDNLLTLVKTIAQGTCESAKPKPPPAITAPSCLYQADLGFVMDASNSIGRTDFQKEKDFVKALATTYALNETLTGVITYSDEARVDVPFNHFTPDGFRREVDRIRYTLGRTRIDKALRLASTDLFTVNGGSRRGFPKVLVILTDGVQTPDPDAIPLDKASLPLRNAGVRIFAVGVGVYANREELLLMVGGNEEYVVMADDFNDLLRKTHEISEKTCEVVKTRIVDGNWGDWSSWSACSEQACGRAGSRFRRRQCNNPAPANGGQGCTGLSEESRQCDTPPCVPQEQLTKCTYQADLGFVMDASASIGPRDFIKEREFVKKLASTFNFKNGGKEGTLAGVITYSDEASIQIPFGRHRTFEGFKNALDQVPYILGRTRIDKALHLAAKSLFSASGGSRRNYPKVLIILTDGIQTPDPDAIPLDQAVIPLREAGITLFGIGVGSHYSREELLLMVDEPNLYTARNFDDLLQKTHEIAVATCKQIKRKAVDGQWSSWTRWTSCTASCAGGSQRRTRTCTSPSPAFGGRNCPGPSEARQSCNQQACPVDGNWSSWSDWFACSRSCGGGVQVRRRTCSSPPPSNGGRRCPGLRELSRDCSQQRCTAADLKCRGNADLGFLMDASASIGETDFQKARDFVKAIASSFVISPVGTLAGVITYSDDATVQIPFGRYTTTPSFSLAVDRIPYTLGRTRIDKALRLASTSLYTTRAGSRVNFPKVLLMMTDGVQTPDPDAIPLDQAVIPLRNAGVKILAVGIGAYASRNELRLMVESEDDLFMARDFDDLLLKVQSIGERTCGGVTKQIVDGDWTAWSSWSACTKTCGGGRQSRRRTCTNPSPSRYGKACVGRPDDTQDCAAASCLRKCFDKQDLGFIMDASASIGPRDFQKERDFVKAMSSSFSISSRGTHVAILTYSDFAEIRMRFGDYLVLDQLKSAIDRIPYTKGRTRIDRALAMATKNLFNGRGHARQGVPKIAVILTDGRQTPDPDAVPLRKASEPLRRAGVRVLAVGVGHYVDPNELRLMVDRPGDVYTVKDFDDLVRKAHDIALLSCKEVTPPSRPSVPPTWPPITRAPFTRPPTQPRFTRPPTRAPFTWPPITRAPFTWPPTRAPFTWPPITRAPITRPPTTGITGEKGLCPHKIDLGFAIASSADIYPEDYTRQKKFVRNVAPYMDISNYGNRFGVLLYGDSSLIEMRMEYYRDAQLFQTLVDGLPFYSQRNRIDKALQTAKTMFDTPKRFREKNSKVLVLLTHGKQTASPDAVPLYQAVQPLRAAGVKIIVIGISNNVSFRELNTVAEKPSDVYLEGSFDSLLRNTEYYQNKICKAGAPQSISPDP